MNRRILILKKLLYPNVSILILLIMISSAALTAVFVYKPENQYFTYIIYVVSAYTLTAVILRFIDIFKKVKILLNRNSFIHRFMTDMCFKAEVSIYTSLGINVLYSVYKAITGIIYNSAWFGITAFYYIILSTVRFLLLHHIKSNNRNYILDYKKYRFCGYLLLILTIAIIGMGMYMIYDQKAVEYPGHIIYAAAGYTFYNLAFAVINIVKYRKLKNPVYSASKVITFAAALVSLFSLQISMFEAFGDDRVLQMNMNILTGCIVFVIVAAAAVIMIVHGDLMIRKLSESNRITK